MPKQILDKNSVQRVLNHFADELGNTDRQRIQSIIALIPVDKKIQLSAVLTQLYPEQARDKALTNFRQLRKRVNDAAAEANILLEWQVDTQS